MTKFDMSDYTNDSYIISNEITQGCIILIKPDFNINRKGLNNEEPFGILIIENACDLINENVCDLLDQKPARTAKVEKLQYIIIYPATKLIESSSNFGKIQDLIQNRKFHDKIIYFPPHPRFSNEKDGFYSISNKIGTIPFKTLKKHISSDYLCITSPLKEHIQNKFIYLHLKQELRVPLKTIDDFESLKWVIIRNLSKRNERYLDLYNKIKPKIVSEPSFKKILDNLVNDSILEYEENEESYSIKKLP